MASVPDIDHLTGLAGRETFAQRVAQADFDRDPFAIALFDLQLDGLNDRHGRAVVDELLKEVGQALALQVGSGTLVCRLDGDEFAVFGLETDDLNRWIAPIATAARSAAKQWARRSQVAGLVRPRAGVIAAAEGPRISVGMASGISQQVWANAEAALETSKTGRTPVVEYDAADLAARRRNPSSEFEESLVLVTQTVELVDRPESAWQWLRLQAGWPNHGADASQIELVDTLALGDDQGRTVERWLVEQAIALLAKSDQQVRLSIPISTEAKQARSFAQRIFPIIEGGRVPPSLLAFEISQAAFQDLADGRTYKGKETPGHQFARQIRAIGSALVVTDFDGGWTAWQDARRAEAAYLRPTEDLLLHAAGEDAVAMRTLVSMAESADEFGMELIVAHTVLPLPTETLTQLGFVYSELAPGQQAQPALVAG